MTAGAGEGGPADAAGFGDTSPAAAVDERELDRYVTGASSAHQRLLAGLDGLGEAVMAQSQIAVRLVAELIQQADAHLVLFDISGDPPVSMSGISGTDAPDPPGASIATFRRSVWALEMAWSATEVWSRVRCDAVFTRWRAVELAHLELSEHLEGLNVTLETLPGDYVREELRRLEMLWRARRPMGLTVLPDAVLALEPTRRLGWFLGRVSVDGVEPAGVDPRS